MINIKIMEKLEMLLELQRIITTSLNDEKENIQEEYHDFLNNIIAKSNAIEDYLKITLNLKNIFDEKL